MPLSLKHHFFILLLSSFCLITSGQNKEWSLKKCIDHAIENNLDVLITKNRVKGAEINLLQSQMSRLPSVNGSASHGYFWGRNVDRVTNKINSSSTQSDNFSLNADLTLFDGFQNNNNISKYKIENQLANEGLDQIKNEISLLIASSYLNILMTLEALEITENQKDNTKYQVEKVKTMVDVGESPQGDLLDIEAQLAQDMFNVTISENNLSLAYLKMTQLLQLQDEEAKLFRVTIPQIQGIEQDLTLEDPSQIYTTAIGSLPRIKTKELGVNSAQKDLLISKGKLSPSLSIGGSLGTRYSSQSTMIKGTEQKQYQLGFTSISNEAVLAIVDEPIYTKKPFDKQLNDNGNFNLYLQLNIPIYNRHSVKSGISRSKLALETANLNFEKEKNMLKNEINRAHTDALAALKKYNSAKKSELAIEASFENARVKFEQNIISTYEFNDLKNRQLKIQSEVIQAKYDFIFKSKILDFYQGKDLTIN